MVEQVEIFEVGPRDGLQNEERAIPLSEKIALVDAGSNFAFKDTAIIFTWQSKSNKVIERLKIIASGLGANGIVLVSTDNKIHQSMNVDKDGSVSSTPYVEKYGQAVAIYVGPNR